MTYAMREYYNDTNEKPFFPADRKEAPLARGNKQWVTET